MRLLRISLLMMIVFALSACGNGPHSDEYLKKSQTVHSMVIPRGAMPAKQKAYYPLPPVQVRANYKPISLVPPGSKVLVNHAAKRARARAPVVARVDQRSQRLVLSMNSNSAWTAVGRALRESHYQIMDQDSAMGTYTVLDTAKTSNKITKNTPIYRLAIKQRGQGTQVSVWNQQNKPANATVALGILRNLQSSIS